MVTVTQANVLGVTVVLVYACEGDRVKPSSVTTTISGVADYVNTYAYDTDGNLVQIVQAGQSGGNAVAQKEIDFSYNEDGQLASITRYLDGDLVVEADYTYDFYGRLVGLVYSQGTTVLASYAWTYSEGSSLIADPQSLIPSPWLPNGGLPASASVATGQGMLPVYDTSGIADALFVGTYYTDTSLLTSCTSVDGTVTYTYDATGQLIAAQYSPLPPGEGQGEGIQANESYTYDANGNRVTANGSTYTTGVGNRLLSDGTYTYAYDEDGNRTARFVDNDASGTLTTGDTEVTQYAWDSRHRLVKVTDYATYGGSPTQIVDYFYDLENRWIGEDIDSNGDGVVDHETRFVYDGNQIIFQFDKDGAGEVTPADLSHRYLWGPAVDQVLADEQLSPLPPGEGQGEGGYDLTTPGSVVWPLADQLGTVRDLAVYDAQTATATVANHRVYDSFGNLTSQTNAAATCLFGFTGRAADNATGLRNHGNRWTDPTTGDWMCEDLIAFAGRDTNLSRYVSNSPTSATDPTGLAEPDNRAGWVVYELSRPLEVLKGVKKPGGIGKAEPNLPGNHTFIYVVDEHGEVVAVYSWMSGGTKDTGYWGSLNAEDWAAARDDAAKRKNGKGVGVKLGSGGAFVDAIAAAVTLLSTDPNGDSIHWNGLLGGNCKMEARKVAALAKYIVSHGEAAAKDFIRKNRWFDPPGRFGRRIIPR